MPKGTKPIWKVGVYETIPWYYSRINGALGDRKEPLQDKTIEGDRHPEAVPQGPCLGRKIIRLDYVYP